MKHNDDDQVYCADCADYVKDTGPCRIKLFNAAGTMIEIEGTYGTADDGTPVLQFDESLVPEDFEPTRVVLEPIIVS